MYCLDRAFVQPKCRIDPEANLDQLYNQNIYSVPLPDMLVLMPDHGRLDYYDSRMRSEIAGRKNENELLCPFPGSNSNVCVPVIDPFAATEFALNTSYNPEKNFQIS